MKLQAQLNKRTIEIDIRPSNSSSRSKFLVTLNDPGRKQEEVEVEILSRTGERWTLMKNHQILDLMVRIEEDSVLVEWRNRTYKVDIFSLRDRLLHGGSDPSLHGPAVIKAQMPGKVVRVLKRAGDSVREGEGVIVVEAMKMQNEIKSPRDGTVVQSSLQEGDGVTAGQILAEIE